MNLSQFHYLPLAPPFFFILVGLFVALLVLIQVGVLRYAYMRLGISSGCRTAAAVRLADRQLFQYSDRFLPRNRQCPNRR